MVNPFVLLFGLSFFCLLLMTVLSALMYVSFCSALRRCWRDGYCSGRIDLAQDLLKRMEQSDRASVNVCAEQKPVIHPKAGFEPLNGC